MGYMGFKKLSASLKGKVDNPGAVAASIGRKKYGAQVFNSAAAQHRLLKGYKRGASA
jgi:hypothetical protein